MLCTWEIISGRLPNGLELNEETGEIFGISEEVGTFKIIITFSDDCGIIEKEITINCNPQKQIFYVKENGAGLMDGSSWSNASGDLQTMIDAAYLYKITNNNADVQVWVANGTYVPKWIASDDNNIIYETGSVRDQTFMMRPSVKIYGGFSGNETTFTERNWETNETILSGERGNSGNSDNYYHVIVAAGVASGNADSPTLPGKDLSDACLDGFTITGGNASGSTPYFFIVNGRNVDRRNSGGISMWYASPVLSNLKIVENDATYSGGLYARGSTSLMTNLIIQGNTASMDGGAIYFNAASPVLINVIISGNKANATGSAIYNASSSPTLTNVTISGNYTNNNASGAVLYNNNSSSSPKIYNSIIMGNNTGIVGGTPICQYSIVQGRTDTTNGNIDATGIDSVDIFVDYQLPTTVNTPTTNGNYNLKFGSPVIDKGDNNLLLTTYGFPTGYMTPLTLMVDLNGDPRLNGVSVDMGPYEFVG